MLSCKGATTTANALFLYYRVVRFVRNYDGEILYPPRGLDSRTRSRRLRRFDQLRLAFFDDAGCCAIADCLAFGGWSAAALDEVMGRDGVTSRRGSLAGRICA